MTPARLEELIVEAAGRKAYVARGDVHGALFWTDMVAALRRLQSAEDVLRRIARSRLPESAGASLTPVRAFATW